jgi:hypothetical protein
VRGNLDGYWRRWLEQRSRLLSRRGLIACSARSAACGLLGVSRLHYTLATGRITSKRGAGRYALAALPACWQPIVTECLRIRGGAPGPSQHRNPLARRRDGLAFVAMVLDDAHHAALPAQLMTT